MRGRMPVSPWASNNPSLTTFAVSTGVWLVLVQWLSAGAGGYLTGRLRTKWTGVHTDEVYFRDTAHGFLSWALSTILVVGLLSSAISASIGAGTQAVSFLALPFSVAHRSGGPRVPARSTSLQIKYYPQSLHSRHRRRAVYPCTFGILDSVMTWVGSPSSWGS
jgi:hypothetical protein